MFRSNFLGTFSMDIFIPPNTIDFVEVFSGDFAQKLEENYVVLATFCLLTGIYVLAMVWARRCDVRDRQTVIRHTTLCFNENNLTKKLNENWERDAHAPYHCFREQNQIDCNLRRQNTSVSDTERMSPRPCPLHREFKFNHLQMYREIFSTVI